MWSFLYNLTVISPLRRLYLNGPEFFGCGFWSGKSSTVICQTLTAGGVGSTKFWENNPLECYEIINQKFNAFLATFETVVYFGLLYFGLRSVCKFTVFLVYYKFFRNKKGHRIRTGNCVSYLQMNEEGYQK